MRLLRLRCVEFDLVATGASLQHVVARRRYKQTVDTVLTFRDSKHTNVKQQVINLIPKMSEFAPEKFVLSYLEPCTDHLLSVLSSKTLPGGIAFQAFGQMIAPLAGPNSVKELQGRLLTRLPTIEHEVADALSFKNARDPAKRNTCMEAITCVGVMAEARSRPPWFLPPRCCSRCECPGRRMAARRRSERSGRPPCIASSSP